MLMVKTYHMKQATLRSTHDEEEEEELAMSHCYCLLLTELPRFSVRNMIGDWESILEGHRRFDCPVTKYKIPMRYAFSQASKT